MDTTRKCQNFFCSHTEQLNPHEMQPVELVSNSSIIHSLTELRENFNPENLLQALLNGNLYIWLEQHYYEKEATQISQLRIEDKSCLKDLCEILGINYYDIKKLNEEEIQKLNERKSIIAQFTSDENILNSPWNVALNQEELSVLINKGEKEIILCKDVFCIPIRVPGMTYTAIGNAKIENPYTAEQYNRAGIIIKGIVLPESSTEKNSDIAKEAALANGYDDFAETHCPLAAAIHAALKSYKMMDSFTLPYNASITTKQFALKATCRDAIRETIEKAYEAAENRFSAYSSKSIAKEAATFYSEEILRVLKPLINNIKRIASMTKNLDAYDSLEQLVNKSYKNLQELFNQELTDSYDYYKMYDINYFIEQVDIEKDDYRLAESGIWRLLEAAVTDRVQYSISGMYTSISELERDVNDRSSTFYNSIYKLYKEYVSLIEECIEIIGKEFPEPTTKETLLQYTERLCVIKAAS